MACLTQPLEFKGFKAKSSIRNVRITVKNQMLFNDRGSKSNSSAGSANTQSVIAKADDVMLTAYLRQRPQYPEIGIFGDGRIF